jgi:TPR repeat protein
MNRGNRLLEGNAVHQIEAAKNYRHNADQNLALGQFNYGFCLANGQGVSTDHIEEAESFKRAAANGMSQAQVAAGVCAFLGIGCCFDFVETEEFFKMDADYSDARGEFDYAIALSQHLSSIDDFATMLRY